MSESWVGVRHFTPDEFAGPMNMEFIRRLDQARTRAGVPFVLSSTYREGDDKAHGAGFAVDIKCTASGDRYCILKALLGQGFHRIGIYDRHIHVDAWPAGPVRVVWWGTSK